MRHDCNIRYVPRRQIAVEHLGSPEHRIHGCNVGFVAALGGNKDTDRDLHGPYLLVYCVGTDSVECLLRVDKAVVGLGLEVVDQLGPIFVVVGLENELDLLNKRNEFVGGGEQISAGAYARRQAAFSCQPGRLPLSSLPDQFPW